MVAPLTPKVKRKSEALAEAPPTMVSRLEEDAGLKKWPKSRLYYVNGILETKVNDVSTAAKAPAPRTNPIEIFLFFSSEMADCRDLATYRGAAVQK